MSDVKRVRAEMSKRSWVKLVKYRQENEFANSASEHGSAEHACRQLQQDLQRMSKASKVYNTALKDAGVYDGEEKRGKVE